MPGAPLLLDLGRAAPVGLLIILLLGLATYVIYRSMQGSVRRVQERAREQEREQRQHDPDG